MWADSCPFWFNYFSHAHAHVYLSHPLTILYPRPLKSVSLRLLLHSQCPRVSSPVHYILSPSLNTPRGSLALFQSVHICITLPPLPLLIVIIVFISTHTNTHHFQTLTLISGQGHVLLTCACPKQLKWVISVTIMFAFCSTQKGAMLPVYCGSSSFCGCISEMWN